MICAGEAQAIPDRPRPPGAPAEQAPPARRASPREAARYGPQPGGFVPARSWSSWAGRSVLAGRKGHKTLARLGANILREELRGKATRPSFSATSQKPACRRRLVHPAEGQGRREIDVLRFYRGELLPERVVPDRVVKAGIVGDDDIRLPVWASSCSIDTVTSAARAQRRGRHIARSDQLDRLGVDRAGDAGLGALFGPRAE